MAFVDLAKIGRARSIAFLLLLTFSSNVSASDESQISNFTGFRSRRSPPIFKAERSLAAASPDSVTPGNAALAPSPSTPLPPPALSPAYPRPPPPSNRRPALITPSANSPGDDLPPQDLLTPPPSGSHSPLAAPISSPDSLTTKQANTAVVLGVTLGVVVVLLVLLSAAVFFKPDWLPCCKGRNSRLTSYANLG